MAAHKMAFVSVADDVVTGYLPSLSSEPQYVAHRGVFIEYKLFDGSAEKYTVATQKYVIWKRQLRWVG
jgi:hypothetical protein